MQRKINSIKVKRKLKRPLNPGDCLLFITTTLLEACTSQVSRGASRAPRVGSPGQMGPGGPWQGLLEQAKKSVPVFLSSFPRSLWRDYRGRGVLAPGLTQRGLRKCKLKIPLASVL